MLTTQEWLPVGSVVRREGREDPVTVLGYMQQDVETGLMWDYFGLDHPMGFVEPGQDVLFDRDSVEGVLYVGYQSFDMERMADLLRATEPDFERAKAEAAAAAREAAADAGATGPDVAPGPEGEA